MNQIQSAVVLFAARFRPMARRKSCSFGSARQSQVIPGTFMSPKKRSTRSVDSSSGQWYTVIVMSSRALRWWTRELSW